MIMQLGDFAAAVRDVAELRAFPIIPCTLCGSQENLQRKQVGEMLREWEQRRLAGTDEFLGVWLDGGSVVGVPW
jgi:tRNA(Ile)-lysidine synthase TilS/MesJ